MPNSLPSTASRLCFGFSGFLNMASSDSASRSRGPRRSAGVSFMPSGIQTLVTAGVAERLAHRRADFAAGAGNARSRTGGCLCPRCDSVKPSADLGCEKQVGLKSRPMPSDLGPGNPVLEMLGLDFVAVHFFAAELAVEGMQVEAVLAGNERQRFGRVGAKFIGRARFAGIIARGHDAAGERAAEIFKAAHVVALPAMQRDGNFLQAFQHPVRVHADGGVAFPGEGEGLFNVRVVFHGWNFSVRPEQQSKTTDGHGLTKRGLMDSWMVGLLKSPAARFPIIQQSVLSVFIGVHPWLIMVFIA